MTVDRLIPSVEDAALRFRHWFTYSELGRQHGRRGAEMTAWVHPHVENAALALDMALSNGRRFDRDRQQAIWQALLDKRLRSEVAW